MSLVIGVIVGTASLIDYPILTFIEKYHSNDSFEYMFLNSMIHLPLIFKPFYGLTSDICHPFKYRYF